MRTAALFLAFMAGIIGAGAQTLAERMTSAGLVDVTDAAENVTVDLMYARDDNFTATLLYDDGLDRAFLHPDAAEALGRAAALLAAEKPGYKLKICDAARPMSVQRKMYDAVRGTSKAGYVGNPSRGGGLHNYGLAVDITITGPDGRELDMGTQVDHLGLLANIDREDLMVRQGRLTRAQVDNRRLLRRVMTGAGFRTLRTEWWHFQMCTRSQASRRYRRLDF